MEDFKIRKADYEDVPKIMNIINVAVENLDKKDMFFADTQDFIEDHIERKGFSMVATSNENEIAGYILVRFPGNDDDNLGKHITENIDMNRVAHMESTAVLPKFRNKGIQTQLLISAEESLKNTNYCYYMCTVDPDNVICNKTLASNLYKKIDSAEKYGGLKRNIMLKTVE